ncbi:MAG: serine/threonine protein phosphatase [Deltaproteobacteria bacterium]|nr:MAG: serine/threonine protein phosphatase [Deltaproteobacteria bacterium]
MARVLRLPDHGRLLVCTDLQGCLRDFERIVQLFEQALLDFQGDAHLLFTGDLIHGPHIDPEDWPDFLGEYYRDASGDLMMAYAGLTAKYSGRVHALLGNHEHGHIGGPHTAKFAADEVALLEQILGPSATARMRSIIQTFALAAVTRCGIVFTHGAPAAQIDSIAELEAADLSGAHYASPLEVLDTPIVGKILWARSATEAEARRFLRAMNGNVAIYGHDVIPEGFETIGDTQMVVSTSFGVFDTNKVYISLDLGAKYRTVGDLRIGHEILPLYPDKAPARLGGRSRAS